MTETASPTAASLFVLELGRALHEYGTPAHRLETSLAEVARHLDLTAEFFSTPTSLQVAIGPLGAQHVHLVRVEPASPDLGNLARLNDVVSDLIAGRLSPPQGVERLRAIRSHPPRWPTWLVRVAFVLESTAVACFLRVHALDVAVASLLGLLTGTLMLGTRRTSGWRPVLEPLAAFLVSTLAFTIDALAHADSGYATSLAGLVILLPGFMFTVALTELSTRNLSSGTARLAGALVVFLGLGFGLALGAKLGALVGHALVAQIGHLGSAWQSRTALPRWSEWAALGLAPLAFAVLLNADRRDVGRIVLACAAAYLTSRIAGARMGEELGAFLGALVVSAGSNLLAQWTQRNPMVTQVPGLLILVPGSIGFRSVTSMLGQEVEAGIATAFRVALIGTSLAAGVLAGNLLVRPDDRAPTNEPSVS